MSNEQWGEWIEHNGGLSPMPDGIDFQVRLEDGCEYNGHVENWVWDVKSQAPDDMKIVAYRYRLNDNKENNTMNEMHPDLKALAEVCEEWPEHETAVSVTLHDRGRVVSFDWRDDGDWRESQWLQARQDLGLVMSEAEEEINATEWAGSVETHDMVNHPPHYTQGGIECIEAIRAALTPEEFRGYCKGAAIKYCWRERHKGGNESLEKANWYLREAVKNG